MKQNLKPVKTSDGSYTFFSPEYDECYHSVKGGAILESFFKFSLPLYKDLKNKIEKNKIKSIKVLDIGFGLGYNILSLIYLWKKYFPFIRLEIISLEKDKNLVDILNWENLPDKLKMFSYILETLKKTKEKIYFLGFPSALYLNEKLEINLIFEDLRKVFLRFKKLNIKFDYIFHDAFSFLKNPEAWSYEVFLYEKNFLKNKGKIFTYACAKPIKRALLELGFSLKLNRITETYFKENLKKLIYELNLEFSVPEKYKKNPLKAIFEIFERHPGLEAKKDNLSKADLELLESLKKDKKSIFYRDTVFLNRSPKLIKLNREKSLK